MERIYIVEESSLFGDIFEDAIVYLSEKSGDEIPKWRSYEIDFVEYICPTRRYYVTLHEGPFEYPGKAVAYVTIDILIEEEKEKKAEIFVKWEQQEK